MNSFSTREAAKKLGLTHVSLIRYMKAKKIPVPKTATFGRFRVHVWSEAELERVRKLLPKIANGRKTRYKKGNTQKKKKSKHPAS